MLCSDAPRFERRRLNREHLPSRAGSGATVGRSRRIVPGGVCERSSGFSALCVSRARCEELATRSSTGDGGAGKRSLGLGDDGATAALDGRPVGWLPLRGATSRAGRSGCCAVLRGLVTGEQWRGRPGRGWGSVGGLVPSQGQCGCLHVPLELVSGPGTRGWAAFCWLDRKFGFPAHFLRPPARR